MPENLLKLKLERLETVPQDFIDQVIKNQNGVFNDVVASLNKLQLDGSGNIILNNENLALIKTLGKDFEAAIIKSGYGKSVTGFVREFEVQKNLNKDYFEKTIDFENQDKFDLLYKVKQEQAIGLLAETAVKENVMAFEGALQNAISNSGSFTDLIKNLQIQIQGNDQIDGGLSRYAKQNALDIFAISERSYTSAIADEMGIEFYLWAGGRMDSSRCFCLKRKDKIYHYKEIQAWGRGEDLGSCNIGGGKWAGMARGTNEDTIFSLAGGYGCVDSLIPKGIKDVPISVIKRNIESGNINKEDLPEDIQKRL